MIKHIPNALSGLRALLGAATFWLSLSGSWEWAFWALAIAVISDMLDGFLAKKLNAKSDFGRDFLDPACDLVLTIGAYGGLLLTGTISWWPVIFLIILPSGFAEFILKRRPDGSPAKKFYNGFMPLSYVAGAVTAFVIYARKGLEGNAIWLLLLLPPVLMLVWEKRERWYGAWLHGRAH